MFSFVEQGSLWLSAIAAICAAYLWWRASTATVPAPPGTHGVGALLGGYLISMSKGARIDLHATMELQSNYNARAAIAAGIASLLTAGALVVKAIAAMDARPAP